MARVVVTADAARDIRDLVRTHQLPADTKERIKRSFPALAVFPELGAPLGRSLVPGRFILGPWRWMIVVYDFDRTRDTVVILNVVDGRTSTSPTANR